MVAMSSFRRDLSILRQEDDSDIEKQKGNKEEPSKEPSKDALKEEADKDEDGDEEEEEELKEGGEEEEEEEDDVPALPKEQFEQVLSARMKNIQIFKCLNCMEKFDMVNITQVKLPLHFISSFDQ